jgi:hypothetical protein
MALIDSRKKLKEYCLRRLGAPVIMVEIEDEQMENRIDDCIQMFKTFHYDGAEEFNLKKTITQEDVNRGYIQVNELSSVLTIMTSSNADKGNVEIMDDVEWRFMLEYNETPQIGSNSVTDYYITMEHLATMRRILTTDQVFTFNGVTKRLYPLTRPFRANASGNLLPLIDSGDWTANGCTLEPQTAAMPSGDLTGHTITDTSGGTTIMGVEATWPTKWYVRGVYTAECNILAGTYTGKVALVLKDRNGTVIKRKTFTPKNYWTTCRIEGTAKLGHINDITFSIETDAIPADGDTLFFASQAMYRNNFYIMSGYKDVNTDEIASIWDVQWVKDYTTQLFKRQWGNNLKKYDGVQMVGGTTVNGQQIYDEADAEIKELKTELEERYTFPPDMMWG